MPQRQLDSFEVQEASFNNDLNEVGLFDIEFGADKMIVYSSVAGAIGISVDKRTNGSGKYFPLPAGAFELNVTVRSFVEYKVLTSSSFTFSIAFVRQTNRKI